MSPAQSLTISPEQRSSDAESTHLAVPGTIPVLGLSGEVAIRLLAWRNEHASKGMIHVATSQGRADQLFRALKSLAPSVAVTVLPPWDCLPYDRASPSREVMGRRIRALHDCGSGASNPLVIATPSALLQRVPPRGTWTRSRVVLTAGQELPLTDFGPIVTRIGYVLDERVDEPGEAAIRGQVIDIFPAGLEHPVRIEHADGRITAIRAYDPATQLTTAELTDVMLLPASECVPSGPEPFERSPGIEHRLPEFYPGLETVFDYLPDAAVTLDVRAEERLATAWGQIADAYESRMRLKPERMQGTRPIEPTRLYLTEAEWSERLAGRDVARFEPVEASDRLSPVPSFASAPKPFQGMAAFVRQERDAGRRVVLTAASKRDLRTICGPVARDQEGEVPRVDAWDDAAQIEDGAVVSLRADLDHGFSDRESGLSIVTAGDVLGSRARGDFATSARPPEIAGTELEFRFGDAVIHLERGLGILQGSETVEADGTITDLLRLTYADEATLMVPVEDMHKLWRYGSGREGLTLDRLDGDSWPKRRAKVEAEIADSARRLVDVMREREAASAPKLVPPRAAYERFVAGFPYTETADQAAAIDDTLRDLASGHPMNRLVCGDVGFGKTEVALRAAAAAALSGKQVAVAAPTTVLVRQHVETFAKRFAGLGIEVAQLSRLVTPAEARRVKDGLASGAVRVVIGTHALAGKGVRFKDLGLVIVDEEQRFGAAHKAGLRDLGRGAHVLTLTATPIPRTLQAALVGLQELSIIATPPARRQPIRTFLMPFDDATVREALLRERGRGGQSFVVCPRVEDIEPMAKRLSTLVPELETFVAHGKMPADAIDDVMVRFADGEGDVLLATNIIESGLDVPRANTMLVWRPDRFGLSQLHQVRGRVGRGRLRGVAYLLTDPEKKIPRATRKRLETLESLDRLGAGFAISARDLDQRGAGDLLGDEQAGHVKLIGVGLYHTMLDKALATARGERVDEDWSPELNVGFKGFIPDTYVPEPEVRINLYARFARLTSEAEIDTLDQEIDDRFGSAPEPVAHLIALARLRQQCRVQGVARLDVGPQAVAVTFRNADGTRDRMERVVSRSQGALVERGERLVWSRVAADDPQRLENASKMLRFLAQVPEPS